MMSLSEIWRGVYGANQRERITGETSHVVYGDDWWPVTDAGRAAIGLRPRAEAGLRDLRGGLLRFAVGCTCLQEPGVILARDV
jgi:hypothetical protein